jgi:hypothetical protein
MPWPKYAPQAALCADPFLVVALATQCLDDVRRELWNTTRASPAAGPWLGPGCAATCPAGTRRSSSGPAGRCGRTPKTSPTTGSTSWPGSPRPAPGSLLRSVNGVRAGPRILILLANHDYGVTEGGKPSGHDRRQRPDKRDARSRSSLDRRLAPNLVDDKVILKEHALNLRRTNESCRRSQTTSTIAGQAYSAGPIEADRRKTKPNQSAE